MRKINLRLFLIMLCASNSYQCLRSKNVDVKKGWLKSFLKKVENGLAFMANAAVKLVKEKERKTKLEQTDQEKSDFALAEQLQAEEYLKGLSSDEKDKDNQNQEDKDKLLAEQLFVEEYLKTEEEQRKEEAKKQEEIDRLLAEQLQAQELLNSDKDISSEDKNDSNLSTKDNKHGYKFCIEDDCPVCLETLGSCSMKILPCGHAIHGICFLMMLESSNPEVAKLCPLCRAPHGC